MRPLLCVFAAGLVAASAWADVAFDNLNTLPSTPSGVATSGPGSLSFNAAQTRELGDYITLGPGARQLTNINIPMAIFAGGGGANAVNPFTLPITLRIYSVDTSGANAAVGSLLNSITQNVNVPGVTAGANNRVYFNVDFSAIGLNITLPNSFIWSIAFDATAGSAQSLNVVVADTAPATPAIGGYGDPNAIWIDSDFVAAGGFQRGTFAVDIGFFMRPTARFDTIPEPSVVVGLGVLGVGLLAFRRRR